MGSMSTGWSRESVQHLGWGCLGAGGWGAGLQVPW